MGWGRLGAEVKGWGWRLGGISYLRLRPPVFLLCRGNLKLGNIRVGFDWASCLVMLRLTEWRKKVTKIKIWTMPLSKEELAWFLNTIK